jgi:transcriptional regulator with XRE-family HTH domain
MDGVMSAVGDKLKKARLRAGYSQAVLSRRIGAPSRSWLASVETGRTGKPDAALLAKLADELGLDYRELLAMTNQLGAATEPPAERADLGSLIVAQTRALEAQTELLREILGVLRGASSLSVSDELLVAAVSAGQADAPLARRAAGEDLRGAGRELVQPRKR